MWRVIRLNEHFCRGATRTVLYGFVAGLTRLRASSLEDPHQTIIMKTAFPIILVAIGSLLLIVAAVDLPQLTDGEGDVADVALDESSRGESGPETAAAEGSEIVLMKFGAPWCPPCRMVDKELVKLKDASLPITIRKINVDEQPDLARKFNVTSIPRLVLMQDGRKIGDEVGYMSASDLTDWVKDSAGESLAAAEAAAARPAVVQSNPYFGQ
jgi:thiol-disulfide isomerase/thioredoxin